MMKQFYVYIMSNHSRMLYTGVSNDLARRVFEHKNGQPQGFTSRYKMTKLVYYEVFERPKEAIAREKQIKGWTRVKKLELVESLNPGWSDLSDGWYDDLDFI